MVAKIAAILDRHPRNRTGLIDILWDVQRNYGHIPADATQTIAGRLGLTPDDVLETASFYHFFHTRPSGRYRIYLCNTVIAKMHGYQEVYEALERETGTRFGGRDRPNSGCLKPHASGSATMNRRCSSTVWCSLI